LPNDVTATGLKISYNQIEKYPAIATWINERDIRIVHLVRKNILKTVLSLETAKRRGLSHATHEVELVKVQLNPNKLKRNLIRRTKQVDRFRNMFVNKPYLEIAYEDLVANQNGITQNVLQFLDIDDFVTLQTDLVKLNPDTIQDIVENYDEVAETLRDTVFEKYL
jgi:LPS sulfotransferase NodH